MSGCGTLLHPDSNPSTANLTSSMKYNGSNISCLDITSGQGLNSFLETLASKVCEKASPTYSADDISGLQEFIVNVINDEVEIPDFPEIPEEFNSDTYQIGTTLSGLFSSLSAYSSYGIDGTKTMTSLFGHIGSVTQYLYDCCQSVGSDLQLFLQSFVSGNGNAVLDSTSGHPVDTGTLAVNMTNLLGGDSKYIINGVPKLVGDVSVPLSANSDNYIEVLENGNYWVVSVPAGDPEPINEAPLRLWKLTTGASSITSKQDLRNFRYVNSSLIPDESINARHFADGSVGTDALETIGLGGNVGLDGFFRVQYDVKGRVTNVKSDIDFTGIANNDILRWNAGLSKFVLYNLPGGSLPGGANNQTLRYSSGSSSWVADSFFKNSSSASSFGSDIDTPTHLVHVGNGGKIGVSMGIPTFSLAVETGGTLTASTQYYYRVSYVDASGFESKPAAEQTISTTVSDRSVTIDFGTPVLGTSKIRIWRSTTSATYTGYIEVAYVGVNTYTDTGSSLTAGTIPTNNDASSVYVGPEGIIIGDAEYSTSSFAAVSRNAGHETPHLFKYSAFEASGFALTVINDVDTGTQNTNNVALKASATNGGKSNVALWAENGAILVGDDLSCYSPNVGISLHSTEKAVQFSRMTTIQRDLVSWGVDDVGIVIFNLTDQVFQGRKTDGTWTNLSA